MYWGLVCLAVSVLAVPFALGDPVSSNVAALAVAGVFAALAAAFFAFDREAAPPERPRGRGGAASVSRRGASGSS